MEEFWDLTVVVADLASNGVRIRVQEVDLVVAVVGVAELLHSFQGPVVVVDLVHEDLVVALHTVLDSGQAGDHQEASCAAVVAEDLAGNQDGCPVVEASACPDVVEAYARHLAVEALAGPIVVVAAAEGRILAEVAWNSVRAVVVDQDVAVPADPVAAVTEVEGRQVLVEAAAVVVQELVRDQLAVVVDPVVVVVTEVVADPF